MPLSLPHVSMYQVRYWLPYLWQVHLQRGTGRALRFQPKPLHIQLLESTLSETTCYFSGTHQGVGESKQSLTGCLRYHFPSSG
jgi:hypothetical protein